MLFRFAHFRFRFVSLPSEMRGHPSFSICTSTMPRAQNRAAKGSILTEDEILFQSGYIIYLWQQVNWYNRAAPCRMSPWYVSRLLVVSLTCLAFLNKPKTQLINYIVYNGKTYIHLVVLYLITVESKTKNTIMLYNGKTYI